MLTHDVLTFTESPVAQYITGPVGRLEILTQAPPDARAAIVIICHPHPCYQGTMHNKVVYTLAKAFMAVGIHSIRFNYRGVGNSAGEYGDGVGECDDLAALVALVRQQFPKHTLYLAGFSFGSYIATRVANSLPALQALVTVAPSVLHFDFTPFQEIHCPWLMLQGDQDEVVPPEAVFAFAKKNESRLTLVRFAECGHFFHGRLTDLRQAVVNFLRTLPHD